MDFFNLLGLASAPGLAIMLYIYWSDSHEREPIKLLVISFLYGCLSVVVTLTISAIIYPFFEQGTGSIYHEVINAFILVALVEEFSKFAFVRWLIYPKEDFNEPYDGIVYTVMVGMGFATVENIMYVLNGGYSVGIMRMFTAVPAHGTFAILMGFFIGKARFHQSQSSYLFLGLVSAVIFHGFYDFFLFINWIPGMWMGAITSLVLAVVLSFRAMEIHSRNSPFRKNR